jgi:hypothetical protein
MCPLDDVVYSTSTRCHYQYREDIGIENTEDYE